MNFSFDGVTYERIDAPWVDVEQPPLVSIVLTAYNRAEQLRETLQSIKMQSYWNVETIVVEDGNDGGKTHAVCHDFDNCTYLQRSNRPDRPYSNCSVPLNMGLRYVRGTITVLQCAEIKYTTMYDLENLIQPIRDNPRISTSACVQAVDQNGNPTWSHGPDTHPNCFLNFCQAVATRHIRYIGGFDESFVDWGLEDNDFEFRLQYSGVECKYVPVNVIHQWHEPAVKNEEDCRLAEQYYKQKLKGIVEGTVPIKGSL
jgi:GT2 family glycosyltransferase